MKEKIKISVVFTVRNEEKMLEGALVSVKGWADEIVVVDDDSTDKTLEIAKIFTDKIYSFSSAGFVEESRNFAIGKAVNEWVLLLDADERVSSKLLEKLSEIAVKGEVTHIYIPRKNIIFGKWIRNTGWWPDYQIRFFKKNKIKWLDKIHSVPQVQGESGKLAQDEDSSIIHENYQTVSQFILRLDRYTTVEAEQSEDRFEWSSLIHEPMDEFYRRFFSGAGYKDGLHGFSLSVLMAFYVFVVQLKIWEKNRFEDKTDSNFLKEVDLEAKKVSKDLKYWFVNEKIKNSRNVFHKNLLRIKRKI